MWNYNYTNELYHHGIKGQKKGVRLYQNPDGSLTPLGRLRYGKKGPPRHMKEPTYNPTVRKIKKPKASEMTDEELKKANARMGLEAAYNKMSTNAAKRNDKIGPKLEGTASALNKGADLSRNASNLMKTIDRTRTPKKIDLSHMTDQQLRDAINRKNLENQYLSAFGGKEKSRGRIYAERTLEIGGTALGTAGSAVGLALAIKQLAGK